MTTGHGCGSKIGTQVRSPVKGNRPNRQTWRFEILAHTYILFISSRRKTPTLFGHIYIYVYILIYIYIYIPVDESRGGARRSAGKNQRHSRRDSPRCQALAEGRVTLRQGSAVFQALARDASKRKAGWREGGKAKAWAPQKILIMICIYIYIYTYVYIENTRSRENLTGHPFFFFFWGGG